MATISPNDHAPDEAVNYTFAGATFEIAPGGTYETDDRAVLSDAEVHPWLKVEYPEVEELSESRESRSVPYTEDVLSAVNSKAFDPDEIAKAREEEVQTAPLAVDAGLDQGEDAEEGDGRVATSIASAPDVEATEPAPAPEPTTPSWSTDAPQEN